jgi:hypothetical protein
MKNQNYSNGQQRTLRKINSIKVNPLNEIEQDKKINLMLSDGYEYLESILIFGNEMIIRFIK